MNKQIILNQCDKIKDIVKDATQNEEEARSNAEKFKEIKGCLRIFFFVSAKEHPHIFPVFSF